MNFPLLTKHAARIRLQDKVLAGQPLHHSPALPFQLRIAREMCLDPCHEFAGAEGLCHVIVRPKAKPADLVDIGLTCRHDDDGNIEFCPDAAAEIESIDMWQHEIQDDEVKMATQRSLLPLKTIFFDHHLKIRCFQIIPLQLCDLTIILHDEDFFHDAHPFLASLTAIPRVLSSCPFREATGRCKGHAAGPGGPKCARPSPRRSVP